MFKRKLLHLLMQALETEDKLIPICANHCMLFSDYQEFEPAVRERFVEVFSKLRDESRGHSDQLTNLIRIIEEEL